MEVYSYSNTMLMWLLKDVSLHSLCVLVLVQRWEGELHRRLHHRYS